MRHLPCIWAFMCVAAITMMLLPDATAVPSDSTGQSETETAAPPSPPTIANDGGSPDVQVLVAGSAAGLLGRKVSGSRGENMGLVVDVLVSNDGTPLAAVIDFGGFLGVGSRKIAVAWSSIHFEAEKPNEPLVLDFSRAQLQSAPAYKETTGSLQILSSPLTAPTLQR